MTYFHSKVKVRLRKPSDYFVPYFPPNLDGAQLPGGIPKCLVANKISRFILLPKKELH